MKLKFWSILQVFAFALLLAVPFIVAMGGPALASAPAAEVQTLPAQAAGDDNQNGIAYVSWWHGQYSDPLADIALESLSDTGANWMSLLVTWYQDTITSTTVFSDADRTPTDTDLAHVIEKAHELGVSVMLKPHLDLANDSAHWRGQIGDEFTTQAQWDAWFAAYTDFISYYAQMAQDLGADQLCVGTELMGTEAQTMSWRSVISTVGSIYTGTLVYAANHGSEGDITWWDDLDYIGVDAYYRLVEDQGNTDPTVEELKATWETIKPGLQALSEQYDRPIIFTEIGYRSVDGMTYQPWEAWAGSTLDLQEQADAYQAVLESVYDEDWFGGMYWWSWDTNPVQGGPCDTGYTPFNKPAENVLRKWYGAEAKALPGSGVQPLPDYDNALSIYSDQLDNGWWNGSWGGTVNVTATDEVYEGDYAIRGDFVPDQWGAVALGINPAIDTTPYRWLEFALRRSDDRELRLFANTDTGDELPKVAETCYIVEDGEEWDLVRVPLTMFYANDRLIGRFALQNFTAMSGTYWMDSVKLIPAAPTLDFTQAEYDVSEDVGEAVITVTLMSDDAMTLPVSVTYTTEAGTALAGSDFITSNGTLVFAPGTTEMTFTVSIVDDEVEEETETLALILSNAYSTGSATIQLGSQNNPAMLNILDSVAEPPISYTLSVNVAGSGSVTPTAGTYLSGSVISLAATPSNGWQFDSWSGDVTGNVNPVDLMMDDDKVVTATFTPISTVPTYTLTTISSPTMGGAVTLNPPGGVYPENTVVTLTAVPTQGYTFVMWSGALNGSANPVTLTMTGEMTVTANFDGSSGSIIFLPLVLRSYEG